MPGRRTGLVIYVFVSKYTPPGWASTLIIIFSAVQLTLGIVGEYIGIIFDGEGVGVRGG